MKDTHSSSIMLWTSISLNSDALKRHRVVGSTDGCKLKIEEMDAWSQIIFGQIVVFEILGVYELLVKKKSILEKDWWGEEKQVYSLADRFFQILTIVKTIIMK